MIHIPRRFSHPRIVVLLVLVLVGSLTAFFHKRTAVLLARVVRAQAAEKKPNILFIMGDDIGWMQPSIFHRGLMVGETPNIARIGHVDATLLVYVVLQSSTSAH